MPRERVLVLDLDGTLVDSLPHLFRAFREAVRPFVRRPPTDAEIVATFGPAERGCLERLLSNPELAWPDSLTHLNEAHAAFLRLYESNHAQGVRLFPAWNRCWMRRSETAGDWLSLPARVAPRPSLRWSNWACCHAWRQ
jgi:phosphoglycolate phosphatase-like HAD superfamily hydrolase